MKILSQASGMGGQTILKELGSCFGLIDQAKETSGLRLQSMGALKRQ